MRKARVPTMGIGGERRFSAVKAAVFSFVVSCALVSAALVAPSAVADPAPDVVQAVAGARGGASCGPLVYDPTVEHAADIINRSTSGYLDHSAENVPADGPHPTAILKDVGIDTTKALTLQGAGHDQINAVKGLLLEGHDAIPDCSYTSFGASHLYEPQTDYNLVVVVLVGK